MNQDFCPLCYSKLEVKDVAPCMECGDLAEEIDHALQGTHTYAEVKIFGDLSLILCDFCQVDFGSFDPEYFGLSKTAKIGFEKMHFCHAIDNVVIHPGKFCPECNFRIEFLNFVYNARKLHEKSF